MTEPAFTSINQFDRSYTKVGNFGNQRSACSLFSLITAFRFMQDGIVDKKRHLQNLDQAVANFVARGMSRSIDFAELLQLQATYSDGDVNGTSVEMIAANIMGYEHIFRDEDAVVERYAVIFLKNYNYFTVLVSRQNDSIVYSVRDCHMKEQYNVVGFEAIKEYLNRVYQFDHKPDLGGYSDPDIENLSNIEFMVVDGQINISLDMSLYKFQSDNPDEVVEQLNNDNFEIVGIESDSDDEYDDEVGDICDEDDYEHEGKKDMAMSIDEQMALALQQSEMSGSLGGLGGDDDMASILAQIAAMEAKSAK